MGINFNRYKTYDTSNGYGNPREWRESFYKKMGKGEAVEIMSHEVDGPHKILGVTTSASASEIKSAFRKLVMQWHPDRNPDNQAEAEAMTKKIIAAYTILSS